MTSSNQISSNCRVAFWWTQGSLAQRMEWLHPDLSIVQCVIKSRELSGNASFVNYVRHHCITDRVTGETFDVVEKSVRKIAFIKSLESRFYREQSALSGSLHFKHPDCFGIIETPFESLIFTRYITGKAPRMRVVAPLIARGIAELESRSFKHLETNRSNNTFRYWSMDFFRPWYTIRSRFSFPRFYANIDRLAKDDPRFYGMNTQLRMLGSKIASLEAAAVATPMCLCHMDYLRKNLFANSEGLFLIDWSEVKVGRIGFDAGSFLAALFRRSEMSRYESIRDSFLETYKYEVSDRFDRDQVYSNMRYFFLLTTLWHCMRPESIEEFRQSKRLPLLKEKLEFLVHHESY